MKLSDLTTLTKPQVKTLENANWTVEQVATAELGDLTAYKGIGKTTAQRVIDEAIAMVNISGLKSAEQLAQERYYQKAPPRKILEDWAAAGLPVQSVALATVAGLVSLKNIDEALALRLISEAQNIVNEERLYESQAAIPQVPLRPSSPAFPVEWLSGKTEPPPMANRVKANFEKAKAEYEAET